MTEKSPTIKPRERVTGERRDAVAVDVVKLYNGGAPIREIAEQLGRSYGWVHRVLADSPDVEFRQRGGAQKGAGKPKKLTGVDRAEYAARIRNKKRR